MSTGCENSTPKHKSIKPTYSCTGSLSGIVHPKMPPITARRGGHGFLSDAGESSFPVESSPRYSLLGSPPPLKTPPGLHGTTRFFVNVAESNSLVKEAETRVWPSVRSSGGGENRWKIRSESIAVPTYAVDPQDEFRRSMEEMVRSRLEQKLAVDWDYLVELVMCYVEMNERDTRKYILQAFVDLIVPFRQLHGDIPTRQPKSVPRSVRTVRKELVIA